MNELSVSYVQKEILCNFIHEKYLLCTISCQNSISVMKD